MLSPDDTHVFILVGRTPRRREEHDRAELRHRERLHRRHPRPHQRRRHAGSPPARRAQPQDRQERVGRRQLRAAGRRAREAGAAGTRHGAGETPRPGRRADREIRWSMPVVSADGRQVVARGALGGQQGPLDRDARSGDRQDAASSTRCTTRRGCARRVRPGRARWSSCPTTGASAFLSERDGWMHLYTLDVGSRRRQGEAADQRQVGE